MTVALHPAADQWSGGSAHQGWMHRIREFLLQRGFSGHSEQDLTRCLPVVLEALGWQGSLRELWGALPYRPDGLTLAAFRDVLARLHFEMQPFQGQPEARDLPLVLERQGRWDVLLDTAAERWQVFDAAAMRLRRVEPFALPESCWRFRPETAAEDQVERHILQKAGVGWFRLLLGRFRPLWRPLVVASVTIHLVALLAPLLVMITYDKVMMARQLDSLSALALGALLVVGTELGLRLLRMQGIAWLGARLNHLLGNGIMAHWLALPPALTEHASVTAQLARTKGMESIRDFITGPAFLLVLEAPFVLLVLALIAFLAGPLVWVPVGLMLVYGLILGQFWHGLQLGGYRTARLHANREQQVMELLQKRPYLRTSGVTERLLERARQTEERLLAAERRSHLLMALLEHLAHALTLMAGVLIIVWGVNRIWAGELSIGALIAVMILTWRALSPLETLCAILPRLEQLRGSIDQVNRFMQLPAEAADDRLPGLPVQGAISLHGVGVRFHRQGSPLFSGLTLDAEPGSLIAVTGDNGSGQSSVLQLLNRMIEPQLGSIRLDGVDIHQYPPHSIRQQVSYLPQAPEIMGGTVLDALTLTRPEASMPAIEQALADAGLADWLRQLPEGIHTPLEQLPAGHGEPWPVQLHLARIYLEQGPILLLDELPHRLMNGPVGQRFSRFLREQKGKRTVFYVTHRKELLAMADQILWLRHEERPQAGPTARLLPLIEGGKA